MAARAARAARARPTAPSVSSCGSAAPALTFFALLPFVGRTAIPHWFDCGWLFAFPLAGAWLAEKSRAFRQRFALAATAMGLVMLLSFTVGLNQPPFNILGARDPAENSRDWPGAELREAFARWGAQFGMVDYWRFGGRLGVALGAKVPICAYGGDPRGLAFSCDARDHLGEDALIIRFNSPDSHDEARRLFREVETLRIVPWNRKGPLALEIGRGLRAAADPALRALSRYEGHEPHPRRKWPPRQASAPSPAFCGPAF